MKRLFNLFFTLICLGLLSTNVVHAQMMIPVFTEPTQMQELSSDAEESMPLSFNNGEGFYFYRTYVEGEGSNTKVLGQDIWVCEMVKGEWERPYRLFRADYLKGDGSIIGTSKDGKRIYLFITSYTKDGVNRKIGYMEKEGKNKWSDLSEIEVEGLVYEERYYSFYMSTNEEILLVSMSPSESHLDEDLYVSLRKEGNKYGELISLGDKINTQKYETAPYIGEDGKTLYFASNGHGGLGESDIYTSRRLDDSWTNWTKPLNLGAPINSKGVDGYFTIGNNQEVFFTSDRDMQHSAVFKAKFTGEFRFAYTDSANGQFFYKGLPADSIALEVYDLDGNLIDEVITDAYGKFTYRKLRPDDIYIVKIKEEDPDDFAGSIIYLEDKNGKRNKRLIFTNTGDFVPEEDIEDNEREQIQGQFNYNSLPQSNIGLVLYDANGFAVDTLYTDGEGKFNYQKLSYDKEFTIVPLDAVDQTDAMDIYLSDKAGNKTLQLISSKDRFSFVPIEEAKAKGAMPKTVKVQAKKIEDKKIEGKTIDVASWAGKTTGFKTVYFEFAQNDLSSAEKAKLDEVAKKLNEDPSLKIVITGHTDNIGTKENNEARGLERANSVKNYLLSKGLNESAIQSTNSAGEMQPVEKNKYERGRSKNRRVEIKLVN